MNRNRRLVVSSVVAVLAVLASGLAVFPTQAGTPTPTPKRADEHESSADPSKTLGIAPLWRAFSSPKESTIQS